MHIMEKIDMEKINLAHLIQNLEKKRVRKNKLYNISSSRYESRSNRFT